MGNQVLKIHGMSVMSAIDDIIANIDDKDVVLELIIEQGQSHAHFGFPENMAAEIFWASTLLGFFSYITQVTIDKKIFSIKHL